MTAHDILRDAGIHITHWGGKIIEAEMRGEFTGIDQHDSGNWVHCACGKLSELIPREDENEYGDTRPKDPALVNLGELFCSAVTGHSFVNAARLLVNIETRATAVILETVLKASGVPPVTQPLKGETSHQQ